MLEIHQEVNGDEHPTTIMTMKDLAECEKDIQNKASGQAIQQQDNEQMPGLDDESRRKPEHRTLRRVIYEKFQMLKNCGLQKGD